jgi:hypothetical protein
VWRAEWLPLEKSQWNGSVDLPFLQKLQFVSVQPHLLVLWRSSKDLFVIAIEFPSKSERNSRKSEREIGDSTLEGKTKSVGLFSNKWHLVISWRVGIVNVSSVWMTEIEVIIMRWSEWPTIFDFQILRPLYDKHMKKATDHLKKPLPIWVKVDGEMIEIEIGAWHWSKTVHNKP